MSGTQFIIHFMADNKQQTMILKDRLLLIISSLTVGWMLVHAQPRIIQEPSPVVKIMIQDTVRTVNTPVVQSVKGKKALFIGDSHSAYDYGWQYQVCHKTGMQILNTAVGGKQTGWMVEIAKMNINSSFDYCFIYGGANDMASTKPPMKAVKNIQRIVDLCKIHNVKAVVITGFDPLTCVKIGSRTAYKGYPERYAKFQQMLIDSIKGAVVVKTHCISRTDCGDFLCHMTASGHRKMSNKVIEELKFAKVKLK